MRAVNQPERRTSIPIGQFYQSNVSVCPTDLILIANQAQDPKLNPASSTSTSPIADLVDLNQSITPDHQSLTHNSDNNLSASVLTASKSSPSVLIDSEPSLSSQSSSSSPLQPQVQHLQPNLPLLPHSSSFSSSTIHSSPTSISSASSILKPSKKLDPTDPGINQSSLSLNQPSKPIPSSSTSKSRTRPITKCDRCRTRKCACDSCLPCETCSKSSVECVYTEGRPKSTANGTQLLAVSTRTRKKRIVANTSFIRDEKRRLNEKYERLQQILSQTTSSSTSLVTCPSTDPSGITSMEIDLEVDNLVTHFSKLWLREEPDLSFFQSSHPTLVRVRQVDLPRWRLSQTWSTWSDHPSAACDQQLTRFDRSLLPCRKDCADHCKRFHVYCDWYFELLTQAEVNAAEIEIWNFNEVGKTPKTPKQWTEVALGLAICRLSLACLDWATTAETEFYSRRRGEQILRWCDLSVLALQRAGLDQNPTVEGIRVLVILLSTIFFETDYGLMGCSPPMLRLRRVAMDVAQKLNLHRDPGRGFSSKEKDDRRRMWWSLVVIDSHFFATGASTDGVIRLQECDVQLPDFRQLTSAARRCPEALDLRSARTRFELGRLNNRCCQLLSQKRPLPTVADIWKLDQAVLDLEKRVPDDQRLSFDGNGVVLSQNRASNDSNKVDEALWNGQQIFYIAIWHIRSKIHRGLLYTKQIPTDTYLRINLSEHREIVKRGSLLLLDLYRHTKLPTAFVSAIASAALTLTLELIERPLEHDFVDIQKIVLDCHARLSKNSSPIIKRACQILSNFLTAIPARFGAINPNGFKVLPGVPQTSESEAPVTKNSELRKSLQTVVNEKAGFSPPEENIRSSPSTSTQQNPMLLAFEHRGTRQESGQISPFTGSSPSATTNLFSFGQDAAARMTNIFPQMAHQELVKSTNSGAMTGSLTTGQDSPPLAEFRATKNADPGQPQGVERSLAPQNGSVEASGSDFLAQNWMTIGSLFSPQNGCGFDPSGNTDCFALAPPTSISTSSLSPSSNTAMPEISSTPLQNNSPGQFLPGEQFGPEFQSWNSSTEQNRNLNDGFIPKELLDSSNKIDNGLSFESLFSIPESFTMNQINSQPNYLSNVVCNKSFPMTQQSLYGRTAINLNPSLNFASLNSGMSGVMSDSNTSSMKNDSTSFNPSRHSSLNSVPPQDTISQDCDGFVRF